MPRWVWVIGLLALVPRPAAARKPGRFKALGTAKAWAAAVGDGTKTADAIAMMRAPFWRWGFMDDPLSHDPCRELEEDEAVPTKQDLAVELDCIRTHGAPIEGHWRVIAVEQIPRFIYRAPELRRRARTHQLVLVYDHASMLTDVYTVITVVRARDGTVFVDGVDQVLVPLAE